MRHFATIAFAAMAFSTTAQADAFTDSIVQNLQDLGYTYIEVKVGPTQVKVEGIKGSREIEVVFDKATGQIIEQETGRADARDMGKTGVEIDVVNRSFTDDDDDDDDGRRGRGSDDDDDDDRGGRGSDDDDRDDDDRGGRGSDDDDRDDDKDDDRDDDRDDDDDDSDDDDDDDDRDDDSRDDD